MKNMLFLLTTAIYSVTAAAGGQAGNELGSTGLNPDQPWDYGYFNGRDWPQKTKKALKLDGQFRQTNECAGTRQSPIDLRSDWKRVSAKKDDFQKMYSNLVSENMKVPSIEVNWNGHTSETSIINKGQSLQMFQFRDFKENILRYSGQHFNFHHGSEHTIDGVRQDLEMHTFHLAEGTETNYFASAIGLMFSVDNPSRAFSDAEVAVIDTFFDDLDWDLMSKTKTLTKVSFVSYGKLMEMVDTNNRWTYTGSRTIPPCKHQVRWNVLTDVHPIKQKHLDQFKKLLSIDNLLETGNWREIQPLDRYHMPMIVTSERDGGLLFLILFIIFLLITLITCAKVWQLRKQLHDLEIVQVNSGVLSQTAATENALQMKLGTN